MSIRVQDLNLSLHDRTILRNLNFQLADGGFHCLVGPSGAGKSQLLRTLAGLRPGAMNPLQKKVSVAFQQSLLVPWLDVRTNIEICTALSAARIDDLLNDFKMTEFQHYKPQQLSGGMQQRAAMVRLFASEGDILLLDEPFSNLDLIHRRQNQDYLLKQWLKTGTTIFFVTHDLDEALYLAQKVFFLSKLTHTITHEFDIKANYPRDYLGFKTDPNTQRFYTQIFQLLERESRGLDEQK